MKTVGYEPTIEQTIFFVRGQKVILDSDLAAIYGVTTKRLNEQVRRNCDRFPDDFMFRLTGSEAEEVRCSRAQNVSAKTEMMRSKAMTSSTNKCENLRSQNATSSSGYGGRRYLPYAFTEHGAVMAANVLNSPLAVQMSVFVVRAFIKMRSLLVDRKELAETLGELEKKLSERLDVHEVAIVEVLRRIMELLDTPPPTPEPPKRPIGFHV